MEREKPTFEEWIKSQKCKCCGSSLSLGFKDWRVNIHKLVDVDRERLKGFYCSNCIDECKQRLMSSRWVADYNNNKIYEKRW